MTNSSEKKLSRGRPKLPLDTKRSTRISLNFSLNEIKLLEMGTQEPSKYVRDLINEQLIEARKKQNTNK